MSEVAGMKALERFAYIALIGSLAVALRSVASHKSAAGTEAIFRRLEIQDSSGHTRIVLSTDSAGTAQMQLTDITGKKNSVIEQDRDGSTTLRFAGPGERDSIWINAAQTGPGPSIWLAGNTDDQVMYLGPGDLQNDVPSLSLKAQGWGLYFPAGGFKPPHAAIGAYRDRKTGRISGFVHPSSDR